VRAIQSLLDTVKKEQCYMEVRTRYGMTRKQARSQISCRRDRSWCVALRLPLPKNGVDNANAPIDIPGECQRFQTRFYPPLVKDWYSLALPRPGENKFLSPIKEKHKSVWRQRSKSQLPP